MKVFYKLLLILNYLAWGFIDIYAWNIEEKYGILFLLPLILFPIIVSFAKKIAISQADKFFKSDWEVFLKEVKWSNSAICGIIAIITIIGTKSGFL